MTGGIPMIRWERILVATDFSAVGENAVATAASLAQQGNSSLSVITVASGRSDPAEARNSMADLVGRLREDLPEARAFVRVGTPWEEIVRLGEELGVDVIVLGRTGRSRAPRFLLGSTAEQVVRNSPVPVLVVGDRSLETVRTVLLPVDMDEGSRTSVRYALESFGPDVDLEAVHIVTFARLVDPENPNVLPPDSEATRRLRAFLDELGAERVSSKSLLGEPAESILEAARNADLVVIATRGRKGLARALLGSVAEEVVRDFQGPVLVVPGALTGSRMEPSGDALEGEVQA